jgi:formamidase
LVVDLLELVALPDSQWGFNGIFAKENGGGLLTEHFPTARKSCWDISGIYATSRHVPGVCYPGMVHPGLIGCLPDHELLAEANRREAALIATDPDRATCRAELRLRADGADDGWRRRFRGQRGLANIEVGLIKGGVAKYGITNPIFKPSPTEPHFGSDYLIFEGISVDEHTGEQYVSTRTSRSTRLPECHRVPEEVRLHGRAGIHDARHRTGRTAD